VQQKRPNLPHFEKAKAKLQRKNPVITVFKSEEKTQKENVSEEKAHIKLFLMEQKKREREKEKEKKEKE
jgi:hypothetical protein